MFELDNEDIKRPSKSRETVPFRKTYFIHAHFFVHKVEQVLSFNLLQYCFHVLLDSEERGGGVENTKVPIPTAIF
jgi:hypothetical protein